MRVPISHLQMDLVMAGSAKGHKVSSVVSAATGYGKNVMDLFHQGHAAFLQTLLTQRVLCGVAVADAFPRTAIGFVDRGTALIFVVLLALSFLMLRAVQFICQIWASGICAWTLRFSWHLGLPFRSSHGARSGGYTSIAQGR